MAVVSSIRMCSAELISASKHLERVSKRKVNALDAEKHAHSLSRLF
jgi:hypothetical protein